MSLASGLVRCKKQMEGSLERALPHLLQVPKGSLVQDISKVVLASRQQSQNCAMTPSQIPMVFSLSFYCGGMRATKNKCLSGEVSTKQALFQQCFGALEILTAAEQGLYSVSQAIHCLLGENKLVCPVPRV